MRFSLATVVVAVACTSASLVGRQFPDCANSCLYDPNVDYHGCDGLDNLCLCSNQAFVSDSTACLNKDCKGEALSSALALATQLCAAVGVTSGGPTPTSTGSSASTSPVITGTNASTPVVTTTSTPNTGSSAGSNTAPAPAQTSNYAPTNSVGAVVGLAAFGLAALAL